jgi:trans-aconitate 2-methyltransferase
MRWDPSEYLRFAEERGRPFHELVARVRADGPAYVVDLGCGPGNLTAALASRWPTADVEGVDSSAEMVVEAQALERPGLRFTQADLRDWAPRRPVDVLLSNATLQWVPGHLALLGRIVGFVAAGGWLAFQVPGNFAEPSHTELAAVLAQPRWRDRLAGEDLAQPGSEEPATYLDALAGLGLAADVWETTYLQVLPGPDAVLRWMQGTALRPVLSVLGDAERAELLAEYGERLRAAYPARPYGTVLPYRRVFAVARVPVAS